MSVDYYPLDFDSIKKGDAFTPPQLEVITQKESGTRDYDFAVMGLRDQIMKELESRNRPATVALVRGNLKVLTDEEAAEYNPSQFNAGLQRMRRAHRRCLTTVDMTNLPETQRAKFEHKMICNGKVLEAVASIRRKLLPKPHERQIPGK